MTASTQRFAALLSSALLVASCWLPTLSMPQARAATSPIAAQHVVVASTSPIVLM